MKILKLVKNTSFYIYLLIIVSFLTKLFNLNYNSPSNDEAVYVAIGHSILFNWNWAIYNFASWLGGHSYFYPVITSIAYFYNGIIGSRILNILFSLLSSYYVYSITEKVLKRINGGLFKSRVSLASLFSSIIFSFSYTVFYISRLATYDMPSFTMLIIGIYLLIDLCDKKYDDQGKAKHFFLASIFLSLSFALKYISILYIPLITITSYIYINRYFKKSLMRFWTYYFFMPLILFVSTLFLSQFSYLLSYITYQINRENYGIVEVSYVFFKNIYLILPVIFLILFNFLYKRRYKLFTFYILWMLIIYFFHLFTNRISAIDKHVIYIVLSTSIFSGFIIYEYLKFKTYKKIIIITITLFSILNFISFKNIANIWPNYTTGINYLSDNMKGSDILLSENGSSLVLIASKKLQNENVVTFDWFEYKNLVNVEAYKKAVVQGYFKYIELESDKYSKPERYKEINKIVIENLDINYKKVLENENYTIYKRVF